MAFIHHMHCGGLSMANPVPNSGRAIPMRNPRTGAPWSVSYDHVRKTYFHEPQGNLRFIRQPFYSRELAPYLVPAGTH